MVSSPPPTSITSVVSTSDLMSTSSSLNGSSFSSSLASSVEAKTRRENCCAPLTICFIRFSSFCRSSGVNGFSTAKS